MVVKAQKSSLFRYFHTGEGFLFCIKDKVLIDPACGSGSLLLKVEKVLGKDNIERGFYGQEIDLTTYNLCRINMFLHNIEFDKCTPLSAVRSFLLYLHSTLCTRILGFGTCTSTPDTFRRSSGCSSL